MAQTNDWITPRLWGEPWFEKPVLYYWAAGIAMRIFGVSEFAARLPSALAALIAVLAVAWTGLRSYGVRTAWYALLMLPTSVAIIGFSRAASTDMLFTGMVTAAMAVAFEILQRPRPNSLLRIAFGFFLGAAVLAKGPAAVILAGAATLLWAAISRQWRAPFRFLHPLVIVVFCATALPWYVLCALRNPDFLRIFIWQHNFERYLTPVFEHRQPFWFFVPVSLLGILPWLPLLISGVLDNVRNDDFKRKIDSPALFIGCWALFPFLFFSASQSKLPGYILPALPPALLLIARMFTGRTEQSSRARQLGVACTGLVFPLLIGILWAKPGFKFAPGVGFDPDPIRGIHIAFIAALLGGGLVVLYALSERCSDAVCIAACVTALILLLANRMVLPALDGFISSRPASAELMNVYEAKPEEIAVYHLPRAYGYGLDYYFGRNLPEWTPENTTASFIVFSADSVSQLDRLMQIAGRRGANSAARATLDGKIRFISVSPPGN
jgi:4-amino-4-deoxy-L-arabinose transferase-like glycosyltransferase